MDKPDLSGVLEALLFATDRPLRPEEIAEVLEGESIDSIRAALEDLQGQYREPGRGLRIQRAAGAPSRRRGAGARRRHGRAARRALPRVLIRHAERSRAC